MDRKYKHYSAVTARWYSTHCLPYFMDVKLFKSPTSADKQRWNISALHLSTTQTAISALHLSTTQHSNFCTASLHYTNTAICTAEGAKNVAV